MNIFYTSSALLARVRNETVLENKVWIHPIPNCFSYNILSPVWLAVDCCYCVVDDFHLFLEANHQFIKVDFNWDTLRPAYVKDIVVLSYGDE